MHTQSNNGKCGGCAIGAVCETTHVRRMRGRETVVEVELTSRDNPRAAIWQSNAMMLSPVIIADRASKLAGAAVGTTPLPRDLQRRSITLTLFMPGWSIYLV